MRVEEESDSRGAVYRDAAADLPPSRRPREYLEFLAGNVVRKLETGPDDRAREVARTTWSEKGGRIGFRFGNARDRGAAGYEIVERSADRLVIRGG